MKATGMTRRVDSLGRVVIPKEIRRVLRISEGSPLEIYTSKEGEIILKKYSPIGELKSMTATYAQSLATTTGALVCIADRDEIIAAAGAGHKNYLGKSLSDEAERFIEERKTTIFTKKKDNLIRLIPGDMEEYYAQAVATILSDGDSVGAVMVCSKDDKKWEGENVICLAKTAADFLGKQFMA